MTQTEYAAKLLRIEAYIMEARSNVLLHKDRESITALVNAKNGLNALCVDILSPDETRIYLAK